MFHVKHESGRYACRTALPPLQSHRILIRPSQHRLRSTNKPPQRRRVCKIALRGAVIWHCVEGDFALAARLSSYHSVIRRRRDIGAQQSEAGRSFSRLRWLTGPASFLSSTTIRLSMDMSRVCDWPYNRFHRYVRRSGYRPTEVVIWPRSGVRFAV